MPSVVVKMAKKGGVAPKRQSVKKAGGTKATVAESKSSAKSSKSLIDQMDVIAMAKAAKGDDGLGRSEEQACLKIVDEKFPGFSYEEVFVYEVDGKPLFQHLLDDRKACETMGKKFTTTRGRLTGTRMQRLIKSSSRVIQKRWARRRSMLFVF